MPTPSDLTAAGDGRHDFDFLFGDWTVAHRRLTDRMDPECDAWTGFDGTAHAQPVLAGLGNVDRFLLPDGEGCTLRLFDPADGTWRIWWSSTWRPGRLDPPMCGRFDDGVGRFGDADDVVDGVAIKVRFTWSDIGPDTARWEQAFSFDLGRTWRPNWVMRFTRA